MVEILNKFQVLPGGSCWYTPWLKSWQEGVGTMCYARHFDFSDHIVLFFSHSFPSMLFEASFCFLIPFLPEMSPWRASTDRGRGAGRQPAGGRANSLLCVLLDTILPIVLLLAFFYLNIITLLAVYGTVAYFHTVGEVIVGYLISLIVQIPVGLIIWAEEWKYIRGLVGFPVDREHMN